jgi:hypothetical protein
MAYDDIQSRKEFFDVLASAVADVKQLRAKTPHFWAWENAERQLLAMHDWTKNGRTPTQKERESIDVQVVVGREAGDTDDVFLYEFKQKVTGLAYYFEFWPSDPNAPVKSPYE